jgi:hypothetical protein
MPNETNFLTGLLQEKNTILKPILDLMQILCQTGAESIPTLGR